MKTSTKKPLFNVWINPTCLEKLNMYATEAIIQHDSEVGGFAKIHENGNDVFVTDIYIPTQEATAGSFDVEAKMDNEFMLWLIKQGRRSEINEWKSLVHSHPVGMDPGMSSVDVKAIEKRAGDTESFSLIISASRTADSVDMLMHYCCKIAGKTIIFDDMPVQVGWETSRVESADKIAELVRAELVEGEATESDMKLITDGIRDLVCTELPPRFTKSRVDLRKEIAADVKAKVSRPGWDSTKGYGYNYGYGAYDLPNIRKPKPSNELYKLPASSTFNYEAAWATVQRLQCIGYEKVDPNSKSVNDYVSPKEAKKARRLHKKTYLELATRMREACGFAPGDLVMIDGSLIESRPEVEDLTNTASEIEDFSLKNGLFSLEVGGEMFWADELVTMTTYEDVMGWNEAEVVA